MSRRWQAAATLWLLAPWMVGTLCHGAMVHFTVWYEFINELAATLCLVKAGSRTPMGAQRTALLCLALAFGCLTAADFLFTSTLVYQTFLFQPVLGEILYTLFFLLIARVVVQQTYAPGHAMASWWLQSGLVGAVILLLHFKFILLPLPTPEGLFHHFDLTHDYVYSVLTAWLMAVAAFISLRAESARLVFFFLSLTLCMVSDFSMRMHASAYGLHAIPQASASWSAGVAGMGLCILDALRAGGRFWPTRVPFIAVRSLRCVFCLATFAAILVAMGGSYMAGMLQVTNADHLTQSLFLVWLCWAVASCLGLYVHRHLHQIYTLMPSLQALEQGSAQRGVLHVPSIDAVAGIDEVDAFLQRYNALASRANEMSHDLVLGERDAQVGRITSQLAHDIQSPLVALAMLMPQLGRVEESYRLLAQSAVQRIGEIASQVTQVYRTPEGAPLPNHLILLRECLGRLMPALRLQRAAGGQVVIDYEAEPQTYGVFVWGNPAELRRAVANLVGNAMQATDGDGGGFVRVRLQRSATQVSITITDSGPGFCPAALARWGHRGDTYGKREGLGLGLSHAKELAQGMGGSLHIGNVPDAGAQVTLRLPCAQPPAWHTHVLPIDAQTEVVIVDDDPSIHRMWHARLKDCAASLRHVRCPAHLEDFVRERRSSSAEVLYLVDYEYSGWQGNGLQLIAQHGLAKQSILVTSHSEDAAVQEGCIKLGLRLLPKGEAAAVPVRGHMAHPTPAWLHA